MPPTLTTPRCHLTAPTLADHDNYIRLKTDPEVRRYLGGPYALETAESRFSSIIDPAPSTYCWVARTKSDDTFLGLVSLDQHQGGNETEVSYEFLPEHWGSGYASETVQAVISFAFKTLDLPQIVAETQTANAPSRQLLERLGMTLSSSTHRFGEPQSIYTLARP